jgi:hypothetical protein
MANMCRDAHIDPELFGLFINDHIYLRYAERFSTHGKSMRSIRQAC